MVTAISNTGGSTITTQNTAAVASSSGGDFETFLRMLTTQIQNQDPLNPMESTEFAVQLATFSGVEQQARTNTLLTQMLQGSTGGELGQLSGWIGREVRTAAPVWYDGQPLTLQLDPPADADQVTLVTLDGNGRELSRSEIGTGSGEVDWQGRNADGSAMADGLYQFRIESRKAGQMLSTTAVPTYSRVMGAELTPTGAVLVLAGNNPVGVDEVSAVRE